jgi:replication initiation and membrane attachment protein DnaB
MNLIETYINNSNDLFFININEPLNFINFMENYKYKTLFKNIVPIDLIEELEYAYTKSIPNEFINISASFDSVYHSNDIKLFDFQKLLEITSKRTSCVVNIDDIKDTILAYDKNYHLSMSDFANCICNSLIKNDNIYTVDITIFILYINKIINVNDNISAIVKLNRQTSMFLKKMGYDELKLIFNDYNSLNPERFLHSVIKCNLSDDDIETINILKNRYLMPDFIINIIIDKTIVTTNKLNRKYATKLAQSINSLGFKTLEEIYDFLLFSSIHSNKHIHNNCQSNIKQNNEISSTTNSFDEIR